MIPATALHFGLLLSHIVAIDFPKVYAFVPLSIAQQRPSFRTGKGQEKEGFFCSSWENRAQLVHCVSFHELFISITIY